MSVGLTVSTIFIVPTLGIDRTQLKDENNNFINGYTKDKNRESDNCVHLLFKPKDLYKFQEFVDAEYERTDSIIEDYDYPDGYVTLVYELNSKYRGDFELIKQGKYSKTSKEFQDIFPKVVEAFKNGKSRNEHSLQYRIFIKSDSLREYWEAKIGGELPDDMEVWDKYDEEKETLNISKIKELV